MRFLPFSISSCLALWVMTAVTCAQSSNDLVRPEVRLQMSSDRQDIKGSSADTKTQRVSLIIKLAGKARAPENRVVKWFIFGKDMKSNDVKILESGSEPLNLDARGTQEFESKQANTTSTPDHAVVSGRGGGRGRVRVQKVEGSGVKYLGYGVEVKDGERVVGKAFSGQSLEKEAR